MVPLKCLSNYWRNLEMLLINYEINLILAWSVNCVMVFTAVANQGATVVPFSTRQCNTIRSIKIRF